MTLACVLSSPTPDLAQMHKELKEKQRIELMLAQCKFQPC